MKRTLLCLALAALPYATTPAVHAAPVRPLITDPAGDTRLGGTSAHDVVSFTVETTKTVTRKKVGRKTVTTTTPKDWVATLRLAAPPSSDPNVAYEIRATGPKCGALFLRTERGRLDGARSGYVFFAPCDGRPQAEGVMAHTFRMSGNVMSWSVPVASVPVPRGNVYDSFTIRVSLCDAVTGYSVGDKQPSLSYDVADAKVTYRWAS